MPEGVPFALFRGGTSKGVFFHEKDIPSPGQARDSFLLRVMGSPNPAQIDGLGGARSVTSKAAIIAPSSLPEADVDYTFAQVALDRPFVDYQGNCGNVSSAVGPFAIEAGLVDVREPVTLVRIFNTNTKKIIEAEVRVKAGRVEYEGDYCIDGVPGTAAPVKLNFLDPGGAVTGRLLPTGRPANTLDVPGLGGVKVSIVDAANPLVFVLAADLGLTGIETPQEIDGSPETLRLLETIRGLAAVKIGLLDDYREAAAKSPAVPKMTVVTGPQTHQLAGDRVVRAEEIDVIGRMMSMQKAHPTYALTGALCTGVAAVIKGTVVNSFIAPQTRSDFIRIGHPGGTIDVGVDADLNGRDITIRGAFAFRTARILAQGTAYY